MKKSKLYAGGLILAMLSLVIGSYFMFNKEIKAYATSTVFVDQAYHVSFSGALKEASITDGSIFVVDKDGKQVEAEFILNDARNMLAVHGLSVGDYTVHVKKSASTSRTVFKRDKTFDVKVVEQPEAITSVDDLTTYFQALLNTENVSPTTESKEESSNSVSSDQSAESSTGSGRHSGTNNQVEDIEEGDIVVTDGQFIYSIMDNYLVITDAKDPSEMKVVKKQKLGNDIYPTQLMLHDKKLIVTYYGYEEKN